MTALATLVPDSDIARSMREAIAAGARRTTPLFDTAGFTRIMESAYRTMVERCPAGRSPDHLDIPAGR